MRQIGHTDPQFTLRVYTHMMSREGAERARLKALVRGERVIARTAPPAESLDLAAVGEAMADRHTAADLEELPSGGPRWQPRLGKARARLVERGWLEASARRDDWQLTERGWAKARRDRVRGDQPPVVTETELAVAA